MWPFRPRHTVDSVLLQLVEGLENGTVVLDDTEERARENDWQDVSLGSSQARTGPSSAGVIDGTPALSLSPELARLAEAVGSEVADKLSDYERDRRPDAAMTGGPAAEVSISRHLFELVRLASAVALRRLADRSVDGSELPGEYPPSM